MKPYLVLAVGVLPPTTVMNRDEEIKKERKRLSHTEVVGWEVTVIIIKVKREVLPCS